MSKILRLSGRPRVYINPFPEELVRFTGPLVLKFCSKLRLVATYDDSTSRRRRCARPSIPACFVQISGGNTATAALPTLTHSLLVLILLLARILRSKLNVTKVAGISRMQFPQKIGRMSRRNGEARFTQLFTRFYKLSGGVN